MPQREALARCADGVALDGCGDAGSGEGVSTIEGSQAAAGAAGGVGCAGGTERHRYDPCAGCSGCVECYWAMAVRQVSTESGTFPNSLMFAFCASALADAVKVELVTTQPSSPL